MQKSSTIYFLSNTEIDKQRWDECINGSRYGLIYTRSFFLDNICPGWKALTGENYEWVLPVTHKTKFGISYLYQPTFTQQLGVFAKPGIVVPFEEIIELLQQHFKFWEISWNYLTPPEYVISAVNIKTATNFILNLSEGYERIAANYHKDLIKNIKRSKRSKLKYSSTNDFNKGIKLFKKNYASRMPNVREGDYLNFGCICAAAIEKNMFLGREVYDHKNELMALTLLLNDGKRLYNLMNVTTEAGRRAQANHFLLDAIIREFSGKELWFDFEGSDLPGVKTFYENFGAVNQPYFMLRYNNLPCPLKWFKK